MATRQKVTLVESNIHPDVREIKGLPREGKARTNEMMAIRNMVKKIKGYSLIERKPQAFLAKSEDGAKAVEKSVKVKNRGKNGRYSETDLTF